MIIVKLSLLTIKYDIIIYIAKINSMYIPNPALGDKYLYS